MIQGEKCVNFLRFENFPSILLLPIFSLDFIWSETVLLEISNFNAKFIETCFYDIQYVFLIG